MLNWTEEHFSRHNVDAPRLAAELLLAHCLGCGRIDLYTRFDVQPRPQERAAYRQLVARAAAHEPVAYLVGQKEFYSLSFNVSPDVLIPRPETELLVTTAIEHLRSLDRPGQMWDIGTGSGCIAVAVAHQVPNAKVLATDISSAAIAIAAENAGAGHVADRVRCLQADLFPPPAESPLVGLFDVITANPPYVADGESLTKEVAHEPPLALRAGPDGLTTLRKIIAEAPCHLIQGGILAIEFGCGQADAVRNLIVASGAFAEPRILRDHQQIERSAVAHRT